MPLSRSPSHSRYRDRTHAGEVLAGILAPELDTGPAIVLAIPNGGVPVAIPIAAVLDCPLDLVIVRKLQIPWNPEAGFGAVTSDGGVILNEPLVAQLGLDEETITREVARVRLEIRSRMEQYRGTRPNPTLTLTGRNVVVVDDGLASGFSMLAAVQSLRQSAPKRLVVAVPTAPARSIARVGTIADAVVCPDTSEAFIFAVANAYENWYDLESDEVIKRLGASAQFLRGMGRSEG